MSKKTKEVSAQNPEQTQNQENTKKTSKKIKAPSIASNLGFSPIALAMFEIQRREVTSNVISGLSCILIGLITTIFSIVKCRSGLKDISVDADKILAYAWMVYAVTGTFIILIGVYEILKCFISMEQIRRWTKTAESHVTPMQEMNTLEEEQRRKEQDNAPPPPAPSEKNSAAVLDKERFGEQALPQVNAAPSAENNKQNAPAEPFPNNERHDTDEQGGFFMGEKPSGERAGLSKPMQPPAAPNQGNAPMQPPVAPNQANTPMQQSVPNQANSPMQKFAPDQRNPSMQPPMMPNQNSSPVQQSNVPQGGQMQMPSLQSMNGMQQSAYGSQGTQMNYSPGGYGQQPVQNIYQALPDLNGMNQAQSNFAGSPFGYVGSFGSGGDGAYNSAMPPYTMHPFRPAQQAQSVPQEQAYNSAMPPYTMLFKFAGRFALHTLCRRIRFEQFRKFRFQITQFLHFHVIFIVLCGGCIEVIVFMCHPVQNLGQFTDTDSGFLLCHNSHSFSNIGRCTTARKIFLRVVCIS